jgi:hypothetical protein
MGVGHSGRIRCIDGWIDHFWLASQFFSGLDIHLLPLFPTFSAIAAASSTAMEKP